MKSPEDANDDVKISLLTAIRIASNKFRNRNFVLHDNVAKFVIGCTKSNNEKLLSEAIFTCVILFEYDKQFKEIVREYFSKSTRHRIHVYNSLDICDLSDQNFELSLLKDAACSQSLDEIKTAMWVLSTKIFRSQHPINRYLDKNKLQLFTLDFIQKLFTRTDIEKQQLLSESLFTEVGDIDIRNALNHLTSWIINEPINPAKHQYIYSKIVKCIFENHEQELILLLSNLSTKKKSFNALIGYTIHNIILDLRSTFNSYFNHHNKTIVPDLRRLIKDSVLETEIETLTTKQLDNLVIQMSRAVEIIDKFPNFESNPAFVQLRSNKKELQDKINFMERKIRLLDKCEALLISMCEKHQKKFAKLTKQYNGKKIRDKMIRCEILREVLLESHIELIKYDDIKGRFSSYSNIENHLGHRWLEEKCNEGHPYHQVVLWLSNCSEKEEIEKLMLDRYNESEHYAEAIKLQDLRKIMLARAWLNHLDECLGYFVKGNEQGKRIII